MGDGDAVVVINSGDPRGDGGVTHLFTSNRHPTHVRMDAQAGFGGQAPAQDRPVARLSWWLPEGLGEA